MKTKTNTFVNGTAATALRNIIEEAATRPNRESLTTAISAAETSTLLHPEERKDLLEELQRNLDLCRECGCVSYDGLADCLQIAKSVEGRTWGWTAAEATARDMARAAKEYGLTMKVSGNLFRLYGAFTPNNLDQLLELERGAAWVLNLLPRTRSGSEWGTQSWGVGAAAALESGMFSMNASGGSIRVLRAVAALVERGEQ